LGPAEASQSCFVSVSVRIAQRPNDHQMSKKIFQIPLEDESDQDQDDDGGAAAVDTQPKQSAVSPVEHHAAVSDSRPISPSTQLRRSSSMDTPAPFRDMSDRLRLHYPSTPALLDATLSTAARPFDYAYQTAKIAWDKLDETMGPHINRFQEVRDTSAIDA
jgi:hypothetical protein